MQHTAWQPQRPIPQILVVGAQESLGCQVDLGSPLWKVFWNLRNEVKQRIVKQRGACSEFLLSVLPSSFENPASLFLPLRLKKQAPKSAYFTTASPFLCSWGRRSCSKRRTFQPLDGKNHQELLQTGCCSGSGCSPSLQIQGQSCLYLKLVLTNAVFKHLRGSLNKHARWIRVTVTPAGAHMQGCPKQRLCCP